MGTFFCEEVGKVVNYSQSIINVGTLTDCNDEIPGLCSCSNEPCNSEKCPLEEMHSQQLKSRY